MSEILDVAIIGAGPAGLSAGLYLVRERKKVAIFESVRIGGTLGRIEKLENYPGFVGSGEELTRIMKEQIKATYGRTSGDREISPYVGGEILKYGECSRVSRGDGGVFELKIDEELMLARSVLVAGGTEQVRLGIPGEELPEVSYCASCDGPGFIDKEIIVVGGGNSAVQEALHLLPLVRKLTLVNRSPLRASTELQERIRASEKVIIRENEETKEITEAHGKVAGVRLKSGEVLKADGVFIFIGTRPATGFLKDFPEILDSEGAVVVDGNNMSLVPGIFAAGDVKSGEVRQAIVAAGDGARAAVRISEFLNNG